VRPLKPDIPWDKSLPHMPKQAALRRYAGIWLAWTAAGLFYSTQDYLPRFYRNEPASLLYMFTGWMVPMYICAVVTPALLWAGRVWPITQSGRALNIARHVASSAAFAAITIGLETLVFFKLGNIPLISKAGSFANAYRLMLVYGFHGAVLRYWAVIGLQAIYRASRAARERERESLLLQIRSAELNRQLASSQLQVLKSQLHPHFLFNTLEAISSMIRLGEQRNAETMIERLSNLLRAARSSVMDPIRSTFLDDQACMLIVFSKVNVWAICRCNRRISSSLSSILKRPKPSGSQYANHFCSSLTK